MRGVAAVYALLVALLVTNPLAGRSGTVEGLVALGSLPRSEVVYEGGMLGVRARAALYEEHGFAELSLRGVPVGGVLKGYAWLEPDGVRIDHMLSKALSRRFVRVLAASRDSCDRVLVVVALPVFGERKIVLSRVAQ